MSQFAILGRRFDTAEVVRVAIDGGRITQIEPRLAGPAAAGLPWISPGWLDIQVNGYGGQEFSSPALTAEAVAKIVRQMAEFGVVRLLPTLTTASHEVLTHGLRTIDEACGKWPDVARAVAGIHVEGPFISTEDGPRGAHPAEHCRHPDWAEFQSLAEAAGGRIRLLTMSVEFDEAPAFIAHAVAAGVVVSIGHTAASGEQVRAAVDAGARLSTHLGNGAHRMLRRHPNYIWDQMAEDRLMASLIVDGHHLPREVVKSLVRAKGPERIILVSDLSGMAGMPAGTYTTSGCELEILADGRLVIAGQDQLLAGASRPLASGVANVIEFAGVDRQAALDMVTRNPAKLLEIDLSDLKPGARADLVLFEHVGPAAAVDPGTAAASSQDVKVQEPRILATLAEGELLYGAIPAA
jgi:N-acetylglucosamine-6-phosphate deacetylase